MSIFQKAKGPASAPTLPSHGSHNPYEEIAMNMHTDNTQTPEMATETRNIGDAYDLLNQVSGLIRVMYIVANGDALPDERDRDGVTWFVMHMDDILDEAKAIIKADLYQGRVE